MRTAFGITVVVGVLLLIGSLVTATGYSLSDKLGLAGACVFIVGALGWMYREG